MTRTILFFMAACVAVVASQARSETPSEPWPVGRLITPKGPICTGVLIGDFTVLTAAHCLTRRTGDDYFSPSLIHFALYPPDGEYLYAKSTEMHVAPGYRLPASTEPDQLRNDWAVLVLDKPLGRSIKPARLRLDRDWTTRKELALRMVAFGRARTLRPSVRIENCTSAPLETGLLKTDCTVEPGSSGSVLLGKSADGTIYALAVNVAVRQRDKETATISAPIAPAISGLANREPDRTDTWRNPFDP